MSDTKKQDQNGAHNAPLFDPNYKPTGLREAALADWNSRLIVGKETVDDAGKRLPVRPL